MKSRSVVAVLLMASCLMSCTLFGQSPTAKEDGTRIFEWDSDRQSNRKSVLLAVALSLALPGIGELYAGTFESGKYHLYAEGGIWIGYRGMKSYSNWIRNDARTFAAEHASAQFGGKDAQFEVNIGDFSSQRAYNEEMLKRRNIRSIYEHPSYFWEWDSDVNRNHFRNMRIKSDRINENATFFIGAAVLNRLISAFSAGRAAARQNSADWQSWDVQSRVVPHEIGGHAVVVRLSATL